MQISSLGPRSRMLSRAFNYTHLIWDFLVLRRNRPYVLGLVITDICNLACALGANYVARWCVTHPYQPIKSVKEGLQKKGFSLLEFLAPCPTAYGRRNRLRDIKQNWEWYDNNTILIEDYQRIMNYGTEEEKNEVKNKFQIGVFQDIEKPGFFEQYEQLVNRLQQNTQKAKGGKK